MGGAFGIAHWLTRSLRILQPFSGIPSFSQQPNIAEERNRRCKNSLDGSEKRWRVEPGHALALQPDNLGAYSTTGAEWCDADALLKFFEGEGGDE